MGFFGWDIIYHHLLRVSVHKQRQQQHIKVRLTWRKCHPVQCARFSLQLHSRGSHRSALLIDALNVVTVYCVITQIRQTQ